MPGDLTQDRYMLQCLLDETDELSEWEWKFLESIESRLKRDEPLTDKQHEKLEEIYQAKA